VDVEEKHHLALVGAKINVEDITSWCSTPDPHRTRLLQVATSVFTMFSVIWLVVSLGAALVCTQTLQCVTVPAGCDAGTAHEETLQKAIQRFSPNAVYGGRVGVFASSISQTGTLAQISYSCTDGSVPPPLLGSTAQAL